MVENRCSKGIILAGGSGTRLYPSTKVTNKHLLSVYDKPMIYYPLTILMLGGINDIVIVTTPADVERFEGLLGDGTQWGIKINYRVQEHPAGLVRALLVAAGDIGDERIAVILGDNIFYGHGLPALLRNAAGSATGATVFAQYVQEPSRFGVIEFNDRGTPVSIVEKPGNPRSNYAVTGLYFYNYDVVEMARRLVPSARGELEITDLNNLYLERGDLEVIQLGRGIAWLDVGTPASLATATQYVQMIENLQMAKVACPEEVAFRMGYIDREALIRAIEPFAASPYGEYLARLAESEG